MDNFLLLNHEVKAYIQKEITLFFQLNGTTRKQALLWDTFTAYIKGAFINKKAYLNRKKTQVMDK